MLNLKSGQALQALAGGQRRSDDAPVESVEQLRILSKNEPVNTARTHPHYLCAAIPPQRAQAQHPSREPPRRGHRSGSRALPRKRTHFDTVSTLQQLVSLIYWARQC